MALVIAIWGIIGYKIFKAVGTPDDVLVDNNNPMTFVPDSISTGENFSIDVSYRDPFLGTYQRIQTKKKQTVKPKVENIVFPNIKYKGRIKPKNASKTAQFILSINNKQYFFSVGKQYDEVTLISGDEKEIVVLYKKQKKNIPLGQ